MPKTRTKAHPLTIISRETGEVMDDWDAEIELPESAAKRTKTMLHMRMHKRWGLIDYQRAAELDISTSQNRILWTIAANVNRETGVASMRVKDLATAVGLGYNTTYLALRVLVDREIVYRDGINLRITPELTYRGSATDWEEETRAHLESR